jgi:Ser/Thr protein kinase RdoA (MazF antagonist)
MYRRRGTDTLPAHLEAAFGITATRVQQLDVGVFRVDRRPGTPVVARLFSARRAHEAVLGDLSVLEQLAAAGFPAERPLGAEPVSRHDGQSVLVTHFVRASPKSAWPAGDPVAALGALIGRLHAGAGPAGAADRPARGAAPLRRGQPRRRAQRGRALERDIEPRVAVADLDALAVLRRALDGADDGAGLPEAFVHPDPVPKNTVFTAEGPVLVDWAGAGRGPRLASLALVLRSSWAGPRFMRGYARAVELDAEERVRAAGLLMTRALIDIAFRVCREPARVGQQARGLAVVRRRTAALAAAALAGA